MIISENGVILLRGILIEDPFDSGYTTGQGVFETIMVNHGVPLFLKEHYERMKTAVPVMKLPNLPEYEKVEKWCEEYLKYINSENAVPNFSGKMRMNWVKKGIGGADLHLYGEPFSYPMEWYRSGIKSGFGKDPMFTGNPLDNHKTLGYAENILAKASCAERGFQECLRVNQNGELCEGSVSNFFWVMGKTLFTPDLETGILPGIMRNWVLDRAKMLNIETAKISIGKPALDRAEAMFYTNSLMGILPVSEFEHRPIGTLKNSIYQRLKEEYQALLGK